MSSNGLGIMILLIISISFLPAFALTENQRATISEARLEQWGASGITIENINVGQQIQISADVMNNQIKSQNFIYLVQIKDENNFVISLSWISGQLSPERPLSVSRSWQPDTEGTFTAELFVWEGLANHRALSEFTTMQINVS